MSRAEMQFGSARWRGIVGDDFTFDRVRAAAGAMARALREERKHPKLLVAFDTRFLSAEFARAAACAIESEGGHALLSDRAAPAPAASFEILRSKLDGGIYIGAGSDPAEYNELRFLDSHGATAGRNLSLKIEQLSVNPGGGERESNGTESFQLETIDLSPAYLDQFGNFIRFDAIRRARLEVAYDAMHGAGAGWLDRLLVRTGVPVHVLNANRDVLFEGRAPDPAPENLLRLADLVRETGAALGLATDSDCAGFGILDSRGRVVAPHEVSALLCEYLAEVRRWRLGVVRTAAAPHLLEAVARHHNLPVYAAAAGLGHAGSMLLPEQAAAVDENRGLAEGGHILQSDGILACLLVAEMVAERGPLEMQLKKLLRRVGAESRLAKEIER